MIKNGLIINANGDKAWYLNDQIHREGGPAIEYADGTKCWLLNGERHRKDGPAIEWANGFKEWYFHGKHINVSSNEKFLRMLKLKAFW